MRLSLFAAAALCVSSFAAHADNFTYTVSAQGTGFGSESGTLATSDVNGVYTIDGISGPGVTGLIAVNGFNANDNVLYPSGNAPDSGYLDLGGFSFTDVMGNTSFNVNVYNGGGSNYFIYLQDSDGFTETLGATFNVAPASSVTPEPSSFALLGTGLLGVAGIVRKRFA